MHWTKFYEKSVFYWAKVVNIQYENNLVLKQNVS